MTLPARLDKKGAESKAARGAPQHKSPELALHLLKRTLANLRKRTRAGNAASIRARSGQTIRRRLPTTRRRRARRSWIGCVRVLEELKPARVLDIGANTGVFSALAAEQGAQVVALERDAAAAESLYRMTLQQPAVDPDDSCGPGAADAGGRVGEPRDQQPAAPAGGEVGRGADAGGDPSSDLDGADSDRRDSRVGARLTSQTLVLEWVPVSDPMYQSLMRGRDALYGSLSEADLLAACEGRFHTLRRQPLENGRILFLFAKQSVVRE